MRKDCVKNVTLTAERLRSLFDYFPISGEFISRTACVNRKPGKICGTVANHGYKVIGVDGKTYLAHRLAFLYMEGKWPERIVDHRDRDRTNNSWFNLRHASYSMNSENRAHAERNLPPGVFRTKRKDRFMSQIQVKKKLVYLGRFETPELAHAAYVAAKRIHHEGNTL